MSNSKSNEDMRKAENIKALLSHLEGDEAGLARRLVSLLKETPPEKWHGALLTAFNGELVSEIAVNDDG